MHGLILTSGGLDSTTLMFDRLRAGEQLEGLFVDYGQRMAVTEERAATATCNAAGIRLHIVRVPLTGEFGAGWLLQAPSTPDWDDHRITHWPHRNLLLITLGAMLAEQRKLTAIYVGFMDIQAEPFPDSTLEFLEPLQAVLRQTDPAVTLRAPFINFTKRQIAVRAQELKVPVDLTFSCTYAVDHHCSVCPSCLDRMDALDFARTSANAESINANM